MSAKRMLAGVVAAILLALAGAAALTWQRRPAETPRESLRLGLPDSLLGIPAFVAIDQGSYAAEGLDLNYRRYPVGKLALDALLRGEVDVAIVAETPIAQQSLRQGDFVILASISCNDQHIRLLARTDGDIHSPADLRGHRIGVLGGTAAQYFLHSVLVDNGSGSQDVSELPLSDADIAEALRQRRVDAVAAFEPYVHRALAALGGQGFIVPVEKGRHRVTFNYVTHRDFPRQRAAAVQRLLRASERAIVWAREHRDAAVAATARHLGMEPAVVDAVWDDYQLGLTLDQNLIHSLEEQARWLMRDGAADGDRLPNYLDFIDPAPLAAIRPAAVAIIH